MNIVHILDLIFLNDYIDLTHRQETVSWRRSGYLEERKTLPESPRLGVLVSSLSPCLETNRLRKIFIR
jgi:hypothetical protein